MKLFRLFISIFLLAAMAKSECSSKEASTSSNNSLAIHNVLKPCQVKRLEQRACWTLQKIVRENPHLIKEEKDALLFQENLKKGHTRIKKQADETEVLFCDGTKTSFSGLEEPENLLKKINRQSYESALVKMYKPLVESKKPENRFCIVGIDWGTHFALLNAREASNYIENLSICKCSVARS